MSRMDRRLMAVGDRVERLLEKPDDGRPRVAFDKLHIVVVDAEPEDGEMAWYEWRDSWPERGWFLATDTPGLKFFGPVPKPQPPPPPTEEDANDPARPWRNPAPPERPPPGSGRKDVWPRWFG